MSELVGIKRALERRRVRVWVGDYPIATFVGTSPLAERHEAKMKRLFAALRVTNEPVGSR